MVPRAENSRGLKCTRPRNSALLIAVVSMFLLYLTWFVFFVMGLFSADWARHAQFWIDSVTPFGGGLITQKEGLDLGALPIDSTAGQGMPRDGLGAWFVLWIGIMACFAMAGATFCEARKAGSIFAPAPRLLPQRVESSCCASLPPLALP